MVCLCCLSYSSNKFDIARSNFGFVKLNKLILCLWCVCWRFVLCCVLVCFGCLLNIDLPLGLYCACFAKLNVGEVFFGSALYFSRLSSIVVSSVSGVVCIMYVCIWVLLSVSFF